MIKVCLGKRQYFGFSPAIPALLHESISNMRKFLMQNFKAVRVVPDLS